MAGTLSGSYKATKGYTSSKGDYIAFKIDWTATQSISGNYSTVVWKMTLSRISGGVNCGPYYLNIDGEIHQKENDRAFLHNGDVIFSGTKKMFHNDSGNRTFNVEMKGGIYYGDINTCQGKTSFTLKDIPRKANITGADNFTDEGSPSITYSNPAGNAAEVLQTCITLTDDKTYIAKYRNLDRTGNKYTYKFTAQELQNIYAATKNSNSIKVNFYVSSNVGGVRYHTKLQKTLTIVNAQPVMNPSIWDSWDKSVGLTGNKQILIRDKSNASYDFQEQFKKGAVFSSCEVTNGSQSAASLTGVIKNPLSDTFVFTLTDSRGNTSRKEIKKTLVPYVRPTININSKIEFASENKINIILTFTGQGFNGSFGAKSNVFYTRIRFKKDNGEYGDYISNQVDLYFKKRDYTATYKLENLDYQSNYIIEAGMADSLNEYVNRIIEVQATPVFEWGRNEFNMNVPFYCQNINGSNIGANNINGVCMRSKYINGKNKVGIKTNLLFDKASKGYTRQTITIAGIANGQPVFGMLILWINGNYKFVGTGAVTAEIQDKSYDINVILPSTAYDTIMFISPEYFNFI